MDGIDPNKLWQNFVDTVSNHYSDFNGRVGRGQFWYFVLVYFVVGILVSIVDSMSFHGGLRALYSLALFLPTVGLTTRRLHDTGRPGAWAWLLAVPLVASVLTGIFAIITILTLGIGAILFVLTPFLALASLAAIVVLVYYCAQPGQSEANSFGPVPPAWTPGSAPQAPTP